MYFANFVTPVFRDDSSVKSTQKSVKNLRSKIQGIQDKLSKVRQKNTDLQLEIFQLNRRIINPARNQTKDQYEKSCSQLDNINQRIESTEKLIKIYRKLEKIMNSGENTVNTVQIQENNSRPQSNLSNFYNTPVIQTPRTNRTRTALRNLKSTLPNLNFVSDLKHTIDILTLKFGSSIPEDIEDVFTQRKELKKDLKQLIGYQLLYEERINAMKDDIRIKGTEKSRLLQVLKDKRIAILELQKLKLDMSKTREEFNKRIPKIFKKLTKKDATGNNLLDLQNMVDIASSRVSQIPIQSDEPEEEENPSPKEQKTVRFDNIPTLNLQQNQFVFGSRTMRRYASALSTLRRDEETSEIDKEMSVLGRMVGHIFVDRFSSSLVKYTKSISKMREPEFTYKEPSEDVTDAVDGGIHTILKLLEKVYTENRESLPLLVYNDQEIVKIDKNMSDFVSSRESLISNFDKEFELEDITNFLQQSFEKDLVVACWITRDLLLYTDLCNHSASIVNLVKPIFLDSSNQLEGDSLLKCSWAGLFSSLFEITDSCDLSEKLMSIVGENFKIHTNAPIDKSEQSKILNLFSLARYAPMSFLETLSVHNLSTSMMLRFLSLCGDFETNYSICFKFFSSALQLIDEESVSWHFAIFFHVLVKELAKENLNPIIIVTTLNVIRSIIEGRHRFTVDQMNKLYILPNMLFNIELEAYPNGRVFNNRPKVVNKHVSMKDIPTLKLESVIPSLNFDNPKLQLHFQPKNENNTEQNNNNNNLNEEEYLAKRRLKPVYISDDIHVSLIELIFSIIIDHHLHKFDVRFIDPFPHVNRRSNVLFPVMKHMENHMNSFLMEDLVDEFTAPPSLGEPDDANDNISLFAVNLLSSFSGLKTNPTRKSSIEVPSLHLSETSTLTIHSEMPNFMRQKRNNTILNKKDYMRLLRLTMPCMFEPKKYSNGKHIASGAFGVVMKAPGEEGNKSVAVKILQKSMNEFENPHLFEVYSEVSILDICKGDRRVTQLVDFGCTPTSYYIVMEFYPYTLKAWRKSFIDKPPVDTMFRVYREFLKASTVLKDRCINHFDIKCDNVMLDSEGMPALADFGESMCYKRENNSYTLLNKGTEWIKSPEMLSIALTSTSADPKFDRRKKVGAGPPSDIWSIGCLLFELLTGHFLFATTDWSYFYTRVTGERPVLDDVDRKELKELGCNDNVEVFLDFVLKRKEMQRPSLEQVIAKYDELFPDAKNAPLPSFNSNEK